MAAIASAPSTSSLARSLSTLSRPARKHGSTLLVSGSSFVKGSASSFRQTLAIKPASRSSSASTKGGAMGANASATTFAGKTFHDFTVNDISGNPVSLSQYKGKVVLVVNVASQCGLTDSNYKELQSVYDKLKDRGLEILAFPCNQFGSQEPGSNEKIKEFACSRYRATFPLFDKVDVNGPNAAPVYVFLRSQKGGGLLGDSIKWNFGKFLVDKEGKVVERYAPTTSPSAIQADIEKLL
ncbi:unnamed protein product [Closterium sp. NIES-53]